jgi:hypothetical protein
MARGMFISVLSLRIARSDPIQVFLELRRLDDLAHAPSQRRASSTREVSSTSPAAIVVAFGVIVANSIPFGFASFFLAGPIRERMTVLFTVLRT